MNSREEKKDYFNHILKPRVPILKKLIIQGYFCLMVLHIILLPIKVLILTFRKLTIGLVVKSQLLVTIIVIYQFKYKKQDDIGSL